MIKTWSFQGSLLAIGSHSGTVHTFSSTGSIYKRVGRKDVNGSIINMDWSNEGDYLQVNSLTWGKTRECQNVKVHFHVYSLSLLITTQSTWMLNLWRLIQIQSWWKMSTGISNPAPWDGMSLGLGIIQIIKIIRRQSLRCMWTKTGLILITISPILGFNAFLIIILFGLIWGFLF